MADESKSPREASAFDRTSDFRCPTCARHGKVQRTVCRQHEWANSDWVAPPARRNATDPSRIRK